MGPHIDFTSVGGAKINPYSIVHSRNLKNKKNLVSMGETIGNVKLAREKCEDLKDFFQCSTG